jgi:Zn-dependent M28 family amino/carboxypeptidase
LFEDIDRRIVGELYFSSAGFAFLEELIDRFGPRFAGSAQEQQAADFIRERFAALGADMVEKETFTWPGWIRRETRLAVRRPVERDVPCIALPGCPAANVAGPLVYVGSGELQTYAQQRDAMNGAIVMATTASPRTGSRMHRTEKMGRAFEAGAVGFIWMRAVAGGLPETGSARLATLYDRPAVAVSYENGDALVRLAARGRVDLAISSTNENRTATSHNVVAEFQGRARADEIIVLGAHYDAHDIGQGAMDNGAGLSVLTEVARVLRPYRGLFQRTLRLVAFAAEEMGRQGSQEHAARHSAEAMRFMLNLDGSARSMSATIYVQGWPEAFAFLSGLFDGSVAAGADSLWLHSDHFSFSAHGVPAAILMSDAPTGASAGAERGFGHTAMDTLDKVSAKAIEMEAGRVARFALRLLTIDDIPLPRKTPAEIRTVLEERGLDQVLRYERRPLPGEG